jgi:hypothetical protein
MMKLEATRGATIDLSPNRQRLAERQGELASVESAVAAELAKAANLDIIHAAVAPARAALATFDAEQAAGMARWASSQTTGRPTSAGARRAELLADISGAEGDAVAATAAREGFATAAGRAAAPLQRLRAEIAEVERLIILEDAELLLPKVKGAIAEAWALHKRIDSLRSAAAAGADISHATEIGRALSAFEAARSIAEARPRDEEPERIFQLPAYAVEAAAMAARAMSVPTTFTGANPPL